MPAMRRRLDLVMRFPGDRFGTRTSGPKRDAADSPPPAYPGLDPGGAAGRGRGGFFAAQENTPPPRAFGADPPPRPPALAGGGGAGARPQPGAPHLGGTPRALSLRRTAE